MDQWYFYFGITSLFISLSLIIRTIVREKEKRKRIKIFEKMDNSKIKAIGDYEKKSKHKEYKLKKKSK